MLSTCRAAALSRLLMPRFSSAATETLDPVQEALLQEQCILVDDNDNAIGQASKRECHLRDAKGDSPLHRAFSLFVFNEKNELLMQQRSMQKITFPGMWTNTCCSHPLAVADEQESEDGRGVKNAAQRKILNELGVEANDCPVADIKYLTRILYSASSSGKWAEHELDYILFLTSATGMTVEPNPNEVMSTEYVGREELDDFVRAAKAKGEGITPWFELIANSLLPMWWKNIGQIERHQDHRNIKRF